MIKIIVAGSRDFDDYELCKRKLIKAIGNYPKEEVEFVCGMAKGADLMGKRFADENGYAVKEFPADWNTHGKAAGPIRNKQMADYSNMLVAFWDGESSGTRHMIDTAQKQSMETQVVYYKRKGKIILSSVKDINKIPEGTVRLFIARQPIKDMEKYGLNHVVKLSPSSNLLFSIKNKQITWKDYVVQFRKEMLVMQPMLDKIQDNLDDNNNIALICYCNNKQCHRYIEGNYFSELGYEVIEI